MTMAREFTIRVQREDGMFWGEVEELPGTFASGETWDEFTEAINEAIQMVLVDEEPDTGRERHRLSSPPMPTLEVRTARMVYA